MPRALLLTISQNKRLAPKPILRLLLAISQMNLLTGSFEERIGKSISFTWQVFMEQAIAGLLPINKEASMQLHYSNILLQVVPFVCFRKSESVHIELEKSVVVDGKIREIDLIAEGKIDSESFHRTAVEMKCYRKCASSGELRAATDIFMKDVYADLNLLEACCEQADFHRGICLVMNDLERLANPRQKRGNCWDYDISNENKINGPIRLTTPIGGKKADIRLSKSYEFNWVEKVNQNQEKCWFLEIEGQ